MIKPKNMCDSCWAYWKDIIESALQNFNVFVGEYKESDLEWLHCHHERSRELTEEEIIADYEHRY